MTVFNSLRSVYDKHRAFRRTRDEIAAMPLATQIDLGLCAEDADALAYRAVYG